MNQVELEDLVWVSEGANSYVYEVTPLIIVKVPKPGPEEKERFNRELEVLNILSRHPPSPYLVTCLLHIPGGVFLEYMRDMSLSWRIQQNHIRNQDTLQVTEVEKLEPLPLRKQWMHDLAHGIAFLESLNLAHGDLRPENILLNRNQLKISDFDCTAEIGSDFDACIAPYGRLLGDEGGPERGRPGVLGPRTEQFALGSIFYLINYGYEVYDDQVFGGDPSGKEHGPVVLDLLQKMVFPELNGEGAIDAVIWKCWHGEYRTIAELAKETKRLLVDGEGCDLGGGPETVGGGLGDVGDGDDFASQRKLCEDFARSGILNVLSEKTPEEHGISMDWRYVCWELLG
ncbi:hypothetical protein BBP40_005472 [Aspergillus hancockii]|nr:hypothetical protein BBP40_005472 [Aspergillus hancockii]